MDINSAWKSTCKILLGGELLKRLETQGTFGFDICSLGKKG